MKGIRDYVIEVQNEFNDTITTESGLELYADKRFSKNELANKIAKVIETPALKDSDEELLQPGYEVMVDITIYLKQIYEKNPLSYNRFHIKDKLFKIQPSMIVMYREDENSEWKGFNVNNVVEPIIIPESEKKTASGIITQFQKSRHVEGLAKAFALNKDLLEDGVKVGDTIAIKKDFGVPYYIDGKKMLWVRNSEILAVIEQ